VRETAAQALGAAGRALPRAKLGALARHLAALVRRPEWEVRLGGLLGLKYLLASRADAAADLLPEALPAALAGLQVRIKEDCRTGSQIEEMRNRVGGDKTRPGENSQVFPVRVEK
jgi:hypothetical protein